MRNAPTCDVHRIIVSAPFCILELDSRAVFRPFSMNQWTWKGRASSRVDALRTDIAYRVDAVRYDPAQSDLIAHHVDELGREILHFSRVTVARMIQGADETCAWVGDIVEAGKSVRMDRWLRTWLCRDDADAVARDWIEAIEHAACHLRGRYH